MEHVFKEYEARRNGIIEALTSDLDELLKESKDVQMNTPFLERKCLWGLPDGSWKIKHAEYQAVGQIPQPQPLIAFGKQWDEWVSRMADLSDAWIISLADYQSRHLSLDERRLLVEKISIMPSLKSVITPECPLALLNINEVPLKFHPEYLGKKSAPTFCMRRKCNFVGDDSGIEEWIECNMCELWYHCKCCDLASEKVETIQFYNCANCLAKEVTYIMIKPDGIQRGLVGNIVSCFEKKGFFLKGLKLFQCPKELAQVCLQNALH